MSRLAKVDFPELDGPVTTVMDGLLAQSSTERSQSSGAISGHNGRESGSEFESVTCKNCQIHWLERMERTALTIWNDLSFSKCDSAFQRPSKSGLIRESDTGVLQDWNNT